MDLKEAIRQLEILYDWGAISLTTYNSLVFFMQQQQSEIEDLNKEKISRETIIEIVKKDADDTTYTKEAVLGLLMK